MQKVLLTTAGILLFIAFAVWGYFELFDNYYFTMNGAVYKPAQTEGNVITYKSHSEYTVKVEYHGQNRKIYIGNHEYQVNKVQDHQFEVVYPNGKQYSVSGSPYSSSARSLMVYDEYGNPIFPSFHVDGPRIYLRDVEHYSPTSLVAAGYPEFHERQGNRALYIVSVLSMALSWCIFRYEGFQTFLFDISPERLSYENPVPSENYYLKCQINGIFGMVISVILLMASVML